MPDIEGWIGDQYIRTFDQISLQEIQSGYDVERYSPGFQVLGSNAGGEGLFLDRHDGRIYWIPFIPLDCALKTLAYESREELAKAMGTIIPVDAAVHAHIGLELHYIQPLIMGGSVEAAGNRAFVPRGAHMELCKFWNTTYFRLKRQRSIQD